MHRVTVEMGPSWKMELMRDVLAEHGVTAFVADSNLKVIDPLITGGLSFDARLEVAEESLADARAALEVARAEGAAMLPAEEAAEEEDAQASGLDDLTALGRRIRWAALLFWMHPFLFLYGGRYLAGLSRARRAPQGNGLTLLTLAVVTTFWAALLVGIARWLQAHA